MTLALSDAPSLAAAVRRSRLLRLGLAAALAAVLGLALAALPGTGAAAARTGGGSVIVLDVSGSVDLGVDPAVGRALRRAARAAGPRAGLVLFSDTAVEVLPPATPVRELERYFRYFPVRTAAAPRPRTNPWQLRFSAGTQLSTGLAEARAALHGRGRIFVISDFDDSLGDAGPLRRQVRALSESQGLELVALPLGPATATLDWIRSAGQARGMRPAAADAASRDASPASFPTALVALTILLALGLGVNELTLVSLRWKEARA